MNYRKICLVGNSVLFLACLGLSGCNNSDTPISNPGGLGGAATGGASAVGGKSTSGGDSAKGGATATSTSTKGGEAAGGESATTAEGGADQGGNGGDTSTDGGTDSGGSGNEGGSSDAGGTSAKTGTAKGGSSSTSSKGGATSVGGTGAGGTSDTGGGGEGGAGTGGPVTPEEVSASDYKFSMPDCGNLVMDVNPKIGGRVSKLTLGGKNVIVAHTASKWVADGPDNMAGSTFWTSPQSAWSADGWPPIEAIDGGAYTVDDTAPSGHLLLKGSAAPTPPVSITKDFSADGASCWITQTFTIKATKALDVAPWQITRVARGGIAFFPQGPGGVIKNGPVTVAATTSPDAVWFDDTSKSAKSTDGSTMIADGADGWFAYALGSILFIKKYTNIEVSDFAEKDKEGEIEIYPDDKGTYLELEIQGAKKSLSVNGTLPWTIQWKAVAIPSSVTVAAKDKGLFEFAQTEAKKE